MNFDCAEERDAHQAVCKKRPQNKVSKTLDKEVRIKNIQEVFKASGELKLRDETRRLQVWVYPLVIFLGR
jgi:predicted Ser/Thr protein kinase